MTMNSPALMSRSSLSTAGTSVPGRSWSLLEANVSHPPCRAVAVRGFEPERSVVKLTPDAFLGFRPCTELVETEERSADDGRQTSPAGTMNRGGELPQARFNSAQSPAVARLEEPAAEQDVHGLRHREVEALDATRGHCNDLGCQRRWTISAATGVSPPPQRRQPEEILGSPGEAFNAASDGSPRRAPAETRAQSAPEPRARGSFGGPRPSSLRAAATDRCEADVVAATPSPVVARRLESVHACRRAPRRHN